jgi:hypothetical protein
MRSSRAATGALALTVRASRANGFTTSIVFGPGAAQQAR